MGHLPHFLCDGLPANAVIKPSSRAISTIAGLDKRLAERRFALHSTGGGTGIQGRIWLY
jgi:hypothetical protein